MKCPDCKKEIKKVLVYSECFQIGILEKNKIVECGSIEEITETIAIECPKCGYNFYETGEIEY